MSEHDDSRRAFLRDSGCVVAALVATGFLPKSALASPVSVVAGRRVTAAGEERAYPVPPADGVSVDRETQVILVRGGGHAYAFALSCPHQNAAVRWIAKDNRFQCTKHDSKYQPDGTYTSGRATRNMDRFAIRRDGDSLLVDLDRVFKSDQDPAGWAAATVAV